MLVIRLFRTGKKNQPAFKVVVIDKRKASTHGRFVEGVGFYNPLTKEKILKAARIKYWLSVGAKPSDTLYNLFVSEKIIEGKKIDVHKEPKEKKPVPAEALAGKEPASKGGAAPVGEPRQGREPRSAEVGREKPAEESKKEGKPKEEKPAEEKPAKEKRVKKEQPKDYNPPTASSHSDKSERAPEPQKEAT